MRLLPGEFGTDCGSGRAPEEPRMRSLAFDLVAVRERAAEEMRRAGISSFPYVLTLSIFSEILRSLDQHEIVRWSTQCIEERLVLTVAIPGWTHTCDIAVSDGERPLEAVERIVNGIAARLGSLNTSICSYPIRRSA